MCTIEMTVGGVVSKAVGSNGKLFRNYVERLSGAARWAVDSNRKGTWRCAGKRPRTKGKYVRVIWDMLSEASGVKNESNGEDDRALGAARKAVADRLGIEVSIFDVRLCGHMHAYAFRCKSRAYI